MAISRRRATLSTDAVADIASGSVDDTHTLGERLGRLLHPGDVVAMYGALGSGKTTLIQGIARGLGRDPQTIKSPTFVLMREYPPGPSVAGAGAGSKSPLVHIDGYRLEGAPSIAWLDLDLIFSPHKITLIEWAERFADLLPAEHVAVRLWHVSANRRKFQLSGTGERAKTIVTQIRADAAAAPAPAAAPEELESEAGKPTDAAGD